MKKVIISVEYAQSPTVALIDVVGEEYRIMVGAIVRYRATTLESATILFNQALEAHYNN